MAQERAAKRFTVDEYYAMGRAGILAEDERVELIEGEVVPMPPIGSSHAGAVKVLTQVLARGLEDRAILGVQDPVRLDDYSEPQPDLSLLRPRADYYRGAHPGPADVLLLVEVADTSVAYDRTVKLRHYARAGIPEAWLVDLEAEVIEVFRSPERGVYRERTTHRRGELVTTPALPGLAVSVDDVLG